MTNKEQIIFVKDLISNIQGEILSKSSEFPKDWNGRHLRQYMADCFKECVFVGTQLKGKEKKNYVNDVIINNL